VSERYAWSGADSVVSAGALVLGLRPDKVGCGRRVLHSGVLPVPLGSIAG